MMIIEIAMMILPNFADLLWSWKGAFPPDLLDHTYHMIWIVIMMIIEITMMILPNFADLSWTWKGAFPPLIYLITAIFSNWPHNIIGYTCPTPYLTGVFGIWEVVFGIWDIWEGILVILYIWYCRWCGWCVCLGLFKLATHKIIGYSCPPY